MKVELIKWKKTLSENNMIDGWVSVDNLDFKENYKEMISCGINLKESDSNIILASTLCDQKIYNAIKIYKKDIIQRFSYDTDIPYIEEKSKETSKETGKVNFIMKKLTEYPGERLEDMDNESSEDIGDIPNILKPDHKITYDLPDIVININTFIEKYNEGYSIKQLANYFNVSNCEIRDIKRRLLSEGKIQPSKWEKRFIKENNTKWSHPKSLESARYNGPCKGRFNPDQLIKDFKNGADYATLKEKYNLSNGSVTNIKRYLISQGIIEDNIISKPSHKIIKVKGTDLIRSEVPSLETQLIDRIDWVKRYNVSVPRFKNYYKDHTGKETAAIFNLDQRVVSKIAKQLGINKRASYTKARIYNPLETISDSQFKWDYNNLTQKEIARKYNIPQGKVSVKVKLMKLDGKI